MNQYKLILLSLSIIFIVGCTARPGDQDNDSDKVDPDAQGYQISPAKIIEEGIQVEISLKDDLKEGELIMTMTVKNNSDNTISVDYSNCVLAIDAERVVIPDTKKAFKTEIAAGGEESYEIYYYPINTVDFFFRSDYRGDMRQQYSLKLDFITDSKGKQLLNKNFTLKLQDKAYHNYMAQYAREKDMQIFDFGFESTVFEAKQIDRLNKITPIKMQTHKDSVGAGVLQEHAAIAINPSITIDKILFNTRVYKYKDTLAVSVRMLNEDSHSLKVTLANCSVKVGDRTYKPSKHFSDSFENGRFPDSTYIFKPGTRLHLLLKYYIPDKIDQFELNSEWVSIQNKNAKPRSDEWNKLFYSDMLFKESPITKDIVNVK